MRACVGAFERGKLGARTFVCIPKFIPVGNLAARLLERSACGVSWQAGQNIDEAIVPTHDSFIGDVALLVALGGRARGGAVARSVEHMLVHVAARQLNKGRSLFEAHLVHLPLQLRITERIGKLVKLILVAVLNLQSEKFQKLNVANERKSPGNKKKATHQT